MLKIATSKRIGDSGALGIKYAKTPGIIASQSSITPNINAKIAADTIVDERFLIRLLEHTNTIKNPTSPKIIRSTIGFRIKSASIKISYSFMLFLRAYFLSTGRSLSATNAINTLSAK